MISEIKFSIKFGRLQFQSFYNCVEEKKRRNPYITENLVVSVTPLYTFLRAVKN